MTQSPATSNDPQPSKISAQTVTLPSGGGSIVGMGESFQERTFTGTATLSVPIPVSPCRDSQPQLSLDYASTSGNGPFGIGFGVSTASVSRRTSQGVPRYTDADVFVMSGYGVLVPDRAAALDTTVGDVAYRVTPYRPRVEQSFDRIEFWKQRESEDSFWRVITRENVTSFYGRTNQARITDPNDPNRVFEWFVEETLDAKGNAVEYAYKAENTQNVPDAIYERNRLQTANKYPERIRYGNQAPLGPSVGSNAESATERHFEIVFDYGEYDINPTNDNPFLPVREWANRPDSFSAYDSGFEIRTHRLCRNILMFHRFTEEFGPEPILVQATRLAYDENPYVSRLIAVEAVGYQYRPTAPSGARYATQSIPPLVFGYTEFDPAQPAVESLTVGIGQPLAGLSRPPDYTLVDLHGDGIPGVLYADGKTVLNFDPKLAYDALDAPINYIAPTSPPEFPINRAATGPENTLFDLDGDGRMELVNTLPQRAGFYEVDAERRWSGFQPFDAFPTDFGNPSNELTDVTGDGRTDVLRIGSDEVCYYRSEGDKGFAPFVTRLRENGVPPLKNTEERGLTGFVDFLGGGMAQRVRVTSGRVECWPNLGYGSFGPKIEMGDAPRFRTGAAIPDVFTADLDGSGTADLVFAYYDRVEIYRNKSGNSFETTPIVAALKADYSSREQITFADVQGNGYQCMVFTETTPRTRHWSYDFCRGTKPYLLNGTENNLGSRTEIEYATSTRYFLKDRQSGQPWLTKLPFPVQVVRRVVRHDSVSETKTASTYSYRHGYYDHVEREFRGFGYVERLDIETPTLGEFPELGKLGNVYEDARFQPPSATKTWFLTGAWEQSQALALAYEHEYFRDDPDAYPMPENHFDWSGTQPDPETIREAYAATAGRTVREEVYGLDQTPEASVPYTVTQKNYTVRLIQPAEADDYGVFFVADREAIAYNYEREAHDPQVEHTFILDLDEYGDIRRMSSVSYCRRPGHPETVPQQEETTASCGDNAYMPPLNDPDNHLIGLPREERNYQINDLPPPEVKGLYFSFLQMKVITDEALGPVPGSPVPAPTATLLTWRRFYYLAADGGEAPPSPLAPQGLLVRAETVAFSEAFIADLFGGLMTGAELDALLVDQGGYGYEAENGYWWNPGMSQTFDDATNFYLPASTFDPFARRVSATRGGTVSTYRYDPYHLLIVGITARGTGGDVLESRIEADKIDYRTLTARRLIDENGNVSEIIEDVLGNVIATSSRGREYLDGQTVNVGFTPFDFTTADDWPQPSSLAELIADPGRYLRGAATFFYYDLYSWMREGVPVHFAELTATEYPNPANPEEPVGEIQIEITYDDGFGRTLQETSKVEPGEAFVVQPDGTVTVEWTDHRWLTSGRVRYNNKGNPFKRYEPYFIATYRFIDNEELNKFGVSITVYFDATGRVVRVNQPRGAFEDAFFDLTEYAAWTITAADYDDTIKDSNYYRYYIDEGHEGISPSERDALVKASAFYRTPTTKVLDNRGNTAQTVARLAPSGDGSELITNFSHDISGNVLWSADPRLGALGEKNFVMTYSLTNEMLKVVSADAGTSYRLNDVLGNKIYLHDARGTTALTNYDSYQRPTQVYVRGGDGPRPLDQIVQRMIYGDSLDAEGKTVLDMTQGRNVAGKIVVAYDQAARVEVPNYTLLGQALSTKLRLWKDYKTQVDWNAPPFTTWEQLFADLEPNLELETFTTENRYDALGRIQTATDAAGDVYIPTYHVSGWLNEVMMRPKDGELIKYVVGIDYDPKGQRTRIQYGNPAGDTFLQTRYEYDPDTFELTRILTTRTLDGQALQNLTYTYDPVGNVTHVQDGAAPTQRVVFRGQVVTPDGDYTYDATYRLLQATGRAHTGLTRQDAQQGGYRQFFGQKFAAHPNDARALENYTATYTYDTGGNLYQLQYQAVSTSWTRILAVSDTSNRAAQIDPIQGGPSSSGSDPVAGYFDANGNEIRLTGLGALTWDYRNMLHQAVIIDRGPEVAPDAQYYQYSSTGGRVRKVTELVSTSGTEIQETIYLGPLQIHRKRVGETINEEYRRLRVMDDDRCVAERLVWIIGSPPHGVPNNQDRFQLDNLLGSSVMEVNDSGLMITYEEYGPYGITTYATGENLAEVDLKEYRYAGKERDKLTGLYYYGARYYIPWVGRWLSTDPAGTVDGLNLYEFVGNNPVRFTDPTGLGRKPKGISKAELEAERKARKEAREIFGKTRKSFYPTLHELAKQARKGDVTARNRVEKLVKRMKEDKYFKKEVHKRVRVRAIKAGGAKKGYGKDELFKTSKTGYFLLWASGLLPGKEPVSRFVDKSGNKHEVTPLHLQEHIRLDTSLVLTKEGGGHTGALRETASSKGYMTVGQYDLHAARQKAIEEAKTPSDALKRVIVSHLASTPNATGLTKFTKGFDVKNRDFSDPSDKAKMDSQFNRQRDQLKLFLGQVESQAEPEPTTSTYAPPSPRHDPTYDPIPSSYEVFNQYGSFGASGLPTWSGTL